MSSVRPDVGLERLIHGLEQELLAAPDEEFVAGARDLGMNPEMKGSAAFIGVKNLSPQILEALRLPTPRPATTKRHGRRSAPGSLRVAQRCSGRSECGIQLLQ